MNIHTSAYVCTVLYIFTLDRHTYMYVFVIDLWKIHTNQIITHFILIGKGFIII